MTIEVTPLHPTLGAGVHGFEVTPSSRLTSSHETRRWSEPDSNPRPPVAKGCFRFGEGQAGTEKSRSRRRWYL